MGINHYQELINLGLERIVFASAPNDAENYLRLDLVNDEVYFKIGDSTGKVERRMMSRSYRDEDRLYYDFNSLWEKESSPFSDFDDSTEEDIDREPYLDIEHDELFTKRFLTYLKPTWAFLEECEAKSFEELREFLCKTKYNEVKKIMG